jgi:DNA-binding MarR family transcriptional regulator
MVRQQFPSQLDSHLGYLLRAVSNAVSHSFARKVDGAGITVAEWVLLRTLYDVPGIAPSQLSERMNMTKGAISKLSDRLVQKGLVARKDNPADRRAHTLALKAAGRAMVPCLSALADDNDAEFFDCIAPGERRELERILRRIISERALTQIPVE